MRNINAAHQRIMDRSDLNDDGCRISRYSVGSHGYAQAWDGVTVVLAHRIVWEWHHGPIPEGMTVDHICHAQKCVEIEHLRLITNLQNARRNGPGDWPLDGTCKHGHDESWWKPKEVGVRTKGYCHACRMEAQRLKRGDGPRRLDYTQPQGSDLLASPDTVSSRNTVR